MNRLKRESQSFSPHKIALLAPVALAAALLLTQVCFRRRQPNPLCGFFQQVPKSSISCWRGVLQFPLNKFSKILGCCFLFFGNLAAGETTPPAETFTVGTTSGYAPYVSLDSKGGYEGFDIDLAKLVAEKLNKKLVIKDLGSMPSLMIGLKQRKVDAIIWAVSITEERQKQMEMVYYQGEKITSMPLLFWGKIPENVKGPEDLKNDPKKIVCVEAGTYQEQVMKAYPGLTLKNVDKITDAIMEVKFGKSLAIAIDNSLVSFAVQQNPELKALYFSLPSHQQSLGNGICINKDNQALVAQVKKAIEELTREGTIQALEKKWNMDS